MPWKFDYPEKSSDQHHAKQSLDSNTNPTLNSQSQFNQTERVTYPVHARYDNC